MKRWMYATAFLAGTLVGTVGCSSKPDEGAVAAGIDETPARHSVTQTPIVPETKVLSTEDRYNLGLKLFDEGSYGRAEQEFERVCDAWPNFSKPFKHLARAQIKLGKFEDALNNALTAAQLNPKDGTVDNVVGMAYMESDDFDSAESAFKSAIEKSPAFAWAYNNLGYLMIQKKEFARARDILIEGGKLEKAPSVLFNNLGMALELTGDTAAAKEAYARAVETDPANAKASDNLSRMETILPEEDKSQEVTQATTTP